MHMQSNVCRCSVLVYILCYSHLALVILFLPVLRSQPFLKMASQSVYVDGCDFDYFGNFWDKHVLDLVMLEHLLLRFRASAEVDKLYLVFGAPCVSAGAHHD